MDGDPNVPPTEVVKIPSDPKADQQGSTKWSSLFRIKPSCKSSLLPVKTLSISDQCSYAISISDEIMDHSIRSMASTLIGKFLGPRPNIDDVKTFIRKKWALKGQVLVTAMAKGFMSFDAWKIFPIFCVKDSGLLVIPLRCFRSGLPN